MGDPLTPEQIADFRARIAGQAAGDYVRGPSAPSATAAEPPGLYDRLVNSPNPDDFLPRTARSLDRLADHPTIRGVVGGAAVLSSGNPASFVTSLGDSRERLGNELGSKVASSLARTDPRAVQLQPMAPLSLDMPSSPTLAQARAPAAAGGGYGSAGGGMGDLAARYKQAQMNQFGTLDRERDLTERQGEVVGERIDKQALLEEMNAGRKEREAELMADARKKVDAQHAAFLARNEQLTAEIGAQKIDPSKILGDKSMGEKFALVLAGMASGFTGQGPQFMGQLNSMIDQGVKAQMANVDNLKAQLGARQNLFGQMMQESGDQRVAELQTRNLMWEAAKQKLGADAARLGIPEVTLNAERAMNEIERTQQNPLRLQMTGDALKSAQAAAGAAAAARAAAEDKAFKRSLEVAHLRNETVKTDAEASREANKAQGDDNGRFVTTGQDKDGNPTGYLARNEAAAEKQEGTRKSNEKLLGLIEEAQKVRTEQGTTGRLGHKLNPLAAAGAVTPEWETKMKILRGRMTGAIKEADSLGTLDAGSQAYADALTGGDSLTGVGGKADDQLRAFAESLRKSAETDARGSGGARATRVVDPATGRERTVITGAPNAPRAAMPGSVTVKR